MGKWRATLENMGIKKNFWENKRVFITGHTGFKGSWLAIWLKEMGANVCGYALRPNGQNYFFHKANVEKGLKNIYGNIVNFKRMSEVIETFKPEIAFHLAAQPLVPKGFSDPRTTYFTNIQGTVNFLDALRESKSIKTIIVVTTDKVYKNNENSIGFKETNELGGFDPYSSSKACSELITDAYRSSFFEKKNIGVATARAGNVIGGGDCSSDRLVPDIFKSVEFNTKLKIRDKNNIRPWQHVLEALRGYIVLAQSLYFDKSLSEPWNFGPKKKDCKKVEWIIAKFKKKFNFDFSVEKHNKIHESCVLKLDTSKSKSKLNWEPILSINDAINLTSDWYIKKFDGHTQDKIAIEQIYNYEKKVIDNYYA